MPNSFLEIIGLWPSMTEFARDTGIKRTHVGTMMVRRSIPPSHWPRVVNAAARRGISGVSFDLLSSLYERRFSKSEAA